MAPPLSFGRSLCFVITLATGFGHSPLTQPQLGLCFYELVDQAGSGGETDPIPLAAGGQAQGDRQVSLTGLHWRQRPASVPFPNRDGVGILEGNDRVELPEHSTIKRGSICWPFLEEPGLKERVLLCV